MAYDKLVDSSQLNSDLGDVADAIRAKSGGSSQLAFPSGFISEIGSISTGGGTLRTTHYTGTITYENVAQWSMTIPASDILATDILFVQFYVSRTGNVANGVTTWDDAPTIPTAFSDSGKRLSLVGQYRKNYQYTTVNYSDGTSWGTTSINGGTVYTAYNKNAGSSVTLNGTTTPGTSIILQASGWTASFCRAGTAVEYTYHIYVMAADGNALVSGV